MQTYVAAHDLPVNYRIGRVDLRWDSGVEGAPDPIRFVGKFMGCALRAGQPVMSADLREAPEFPLIPGKVPYLVPLRGQPTLSRVLNAGSIVDLWHDFRPLLRQIPILAILCPDGSVADCTVVIDVSARETDELTRADPKKLRLLIRKPGK
jgi:hypothetical protein